MVPQKLYQGNGGQKLGRIRVKFGPGKLGNLHLPLQCILGPVFQYQTEREWWMVLGNLEGRFVEKQKGSMARHLAQSTETQDSQY